MANKIFKIGQIYTIRSGNAFCDMKVVSISDGFCRFEGVNDPQIRCSGILYQLTYPKAQSCDIDGCDMVFSYDVKIDVNKDGKKVKASFSQIIEYIRGGGADGRTSYSVLRKFPNVNVKEAVYEICGMDSPPIIRMIDASDTKLNVRFFCVEFKDLIDLSRFRCPKTGNFFGEKI